VPSGFWLAIFQGAKRLDGVGLSTSINLDGVNEASIESAHCQRKELEPRLSVKQLFGFFMGRLGDRNNEQTIERCLFDRS
jgi:hypothetical protein